MRAIEVSVIDAMREYQKQNPDYSFLWIQFYSSGNMHARIERISPPNQIIVQIFLDSTEPIICGDADDEFRKSLSARLKR